MQIHQLAQGTPEWHAYRANHFNASDAPAMMGVSPYKTRSQLIHELATGLDREVDAATQRIFDDGHRFEALARPLAEEIIGQDLYPVVGSEGKYSASFDGLTMAEDDGFEHKSLNDELRAVMVDGCTGADLPMLYQVQMEQQCMVSKANRILFMASKWQGEQLVDMRHCWYYPNLELRAQIVAGWKQLEQDVAAYVPPEAKVEVVGRTPESLPALHIEVTGMVTASNLGSFREHAMAVFGAINRDLKTDQQFADAEKTVKWCGEVEDRLAAAKQHALSQTQSIDALFRTIDEISAEARATRLELDKLVKARKEAIRAEIMQEGVQALRDHIAGLNDRLGKPYMPTVAADFAGAIRGKKTVSSLRDAVATTLANAKIEANSIADRIQINLNTLREWASNHAFLFADTAQIVLKSPDDLTSLVKMRIAEHKEAEEKRLEAERARIAEEERIKAEAAAKAELDRQQQELARQQAAIAAAKAEQEAAERRQREAAEAAARNKAGEAHAASILQDVTPRANEALADQDEIVPGPSLAEALKSPQPTLRLGQIGERLGFAVTAAFLRELGFEPAGKEGTAVMYFGSDFDGICSALIARIQVVQDEYRLKRAA